MAEQQKPAMRFDAMQGLIRHTGGRGIMLNGVNVEVPEECFAFVGIELVIFRNMMMPKIRELQGPMAQRYSAMHFGEEHLQHVIQQSAMVGGMDVPFVFSFDRPRPKTSVN